MPRANRHFLPGHIWHITHRCHQREFMLKFARDRDRWLTWLFEARKRYALSILNYVVTANHIHLLLVDTGHESSIPQAMQLIAGRTAQEYNARKKRRGAFWEDRYHATAVEDGDHLVRCMTYIDLNMVRAGVVEHPGGWRFSGFHECREQKHRYQLLDRERIQLLFRKRSWPEFRIWREEVIRRNLAPDSRFRRRDDRWTGAIAVGSETYIERIREELKSSAQGPQVRRFDDDSHCLKETLQPYRCVFGV